MFRAMSRLAAELEIAESVMIRQGTLEEGLRIARNMEQEGVDVIVSRGGTMELLLGANIRTPLVNIAISMQDTSAMLRTARILTGLPRPKIALVAYAKVVSDVASFSALLDMDLHIYQSGPTRESIVAALEQALREKADAIVGGVTTQNALAGRTIPFIPHESGDASLRQALAEAKLIAYARSLEQMQTERFKAVMAFSAEGIFLLEADGGILAANPAARKLLNLAVNPEGRKVEDVFPLALTAECLSTGVPVQNEIVTLPDMVYIAALTPFVSQGRVSGAILSFQPATRIVEMEAKIRRSRSAKGMSALHRFGDIEGVSPQIREAGETAARYAAVDETVLLRGETGTGKELFAQAMHNASPRRNGPFVAVNCAALPATLLESEFFGYEEGAFTGANRRGKTGFFELADQGTIFLDEVAGLDGHGQSRLLRVLQERSILRLGGDAYVPVNFRVIAASNVDLWPLVQRGEFRQDLFFRLHVLPLVIPPLREREGDVRHLARLFLARHAQAGTRLTFAPEAAGALASHPWPGNVRELEHCVRRICLSVTGGVVSPAHVRRALSFTPPPAREGEGALFRAGPRSDLPTVPEGAASAGSAAPLREAERATLLGALRAAEGNQRRAAAFLGINASTLYRKMKKLGISRERPF
jgi:transcriptional regulator with PAS, ATPase and Fis domain